MKIFYIFLFILSQISAFGFSEIFSREYFQDAINGNATKANSICSFSQVYGYRIMDKNSSQAIEEIDDKTLSNIIEYELIPLLKEYWFDESTKVHDWSSTLRGAIK